MTLYTKSGDEGNTTTMNGVSHRKNDTVIEINGNIDELIVSIERIRTKYFYTETIEVDTTETTQDKKTLKQLNKIIEALYLLGAEISDGRTTNLTKCIDKGFVDRLEERIDEIYSPLKDFVHFKKLDAINISEARVRTRSLERNLTSLIIDGQLRSFVFQYINRLSDYLFALAVYEENK